MMMWCCIGDGGRPAGVGVQALISNHRSALCSKGMVLSRAEKSSLRGQMWIMETSELKPSLKRREVPNDVKTSGYFSHWDKSKGDLITDLDGVRRKGGVNMILALIRNLRPYCVDVKGKVQAAEAVQGESTDARNRFGLAHSSDEVWETRWSEGAESFGLIYMSTAHAGGAHE